MWMDGVAGRKAELQRTFPVFRSKPLSSSHCSFRLKSNTGARLFAPTCAHHTLCWFLLPRTAVSTVCFVNLFMPKTHWARFWRPDLLTQSLTEPGPLPNSWYHMIHTCSVSLTVTKHKFQSHTDLYVSCFPRIHFSICSCFCFFFLKLGKGKFEETTLKKIFTPQSSFVFIDVPF